MVEKCWKITAHNKPGHLIYDYVSYVDWSIFVVWQKLPFDYDVFCQQKADSSLKISLYRKMITKST